MSGAALGDYDAAFRSVRGKGGGVVPHGSLAIPAALPLRAAAAAGEDTSGFAQVQRAREASDAMWKANDYQTVDCDCGAKLRVPPGLKRNEIRCPRCGTTHKLSR